MEQIGFDFEYIPKRTVRNMSADELYDEMSVNIAVDMEENQKIERKSARVAPRQLGDYFSMWANTPPFGGVIIIGVENDGRLTGCNSVSTPHLNDLHRAGDVHCPEARYTSKEIPIINRDGDSDILLVFRVLYREDRVVETNAREAFARRGGSKRLLDEAEKRELAQSKGQLEIEREPVSLKYPDDFRISLINQFVDNVRRDRGMSTSHTPEQILELRRLGKIGRSGFKPNLACALLFAKDPQLAVPGCKIRFLRFDGTSEKTGKEHNVVKSAWIEGPVPELILEAEKVLSAQLREFMRLGSDGKFVSTAEYPKDAWYEAVVNACVHRSYNLSSMHTVIKMFDDRLEVESPGGFPPLVTPENIYDVHVPRNPHLMDAMFYLKFVLCEHEGTRRIRDSMTGLGLPAPVFTEITATAAYFRVTLSNDVEHRQQFVDSDAFMVLGEALSSTLTPVERRIVNYIAEHGNINATEASRLTGIRWHTIKNILMGLVARNILDHVHSATIERDRHAYFILKKRYSDRLRSRDQ